MPIRIVHQFPERSLVHHLIHGAVWNLGAFFNHLEEMIGIIAKHKAADFSLLQIVYAVSIRILNVKNTFKFVFSQKAQNTVIVPIEAFRVFLNHIAEFRTALNFLKNIFHGGLIGHH